MAYRPMSQPDPFDPPRPSDAPIPLGGGQSSLEDGLSLAELATALSEHGGGFLSADLALDLVLNEIVEHARLATGATAAAIALARGDEIVCRATTGDNAPDLGVRLEAQSGLSGACVQSQQWQRCDDTETDPRVDAEICRSLGVRSILVFPVVKQKKLLGVFEIFSPRPNAFSDREIQTLEALSLSIVNNVDRAADVLATPTSAISSSPTAATSVDSIAEITGASEVSSSAVEVAAANHSQSEPPALAADPSPEAAVDTSPARKEYWTFALTLAVIAVALFLGWMLGYARKQKVSAGVKARMAANSAASAEVKPPQPASLRESQILSPTPAPTASSAAFSAPNSAASAAQAGGLVVYENGKVIFRATPTAARSSAKVSSSALMVPPKVADEYVLQRVEPEYPEQAREQHIQGPVVLVALVGKDGVVEKLNTVSGDPQLVAAATDAVQQWRFRPFFRNGAPEEFQTQITVSFRLP